MDTLARAGELSLKLPTDAKHDKLGGAGKASKAPNPRSRPKPLSASASEASSSSVPSRALAIVARNDPQSAAFIDKFTQQNCKRDVSDEWRQIDERKLDTLRGILAALKEENQATQLLKRESDDRQAGQELDAMRQSVKRRLEAVKAQEGVFDQKHAELRKHVIENEKSLRLMETNIEKGERQVKEEQFECRRLDQDIKAVNRDIEEAEEGRSEEERQIARASEHKAFLEGVVQECEEDFEGDIKVLMNRYHTLNAEKQSLHKRNEALASQLNHVREEWLKVQTELQIEQMMSSSRLHEAQVALERHRADNAELEERLNRILEDRELRKSQVGVVQMAIDQIFTRIVQSCRLKQRKEAMLDAVESARFAPVRGIADARIEAMFPQIIARVRDLHIMSEELKDHLEKQKKTEVANLDDEVDILDKVQFVQCIEKEEFSQAGMPQAADVALSGGSGSKQGMSSASATTSGEAGAPVGAGGASGPHPTAPSPSLRKSKSGRKHVSRHNSSEPPGPVGIMTEVNEKGVLQAFGK